MYGFHPLKRWRLRHVPGPRPMWLVGSIPLIATKGWYAAMQELSEQYGPIFKVFVGAIAHVVVTDPEMARKLSQSVARPEIGIPTMTVGRARTFEQFQLIFVE